MLANGAPPLHPLTTLRAKRIQTHSSSSCFVLCVKSNRRVFLGLPGSGCREKRFDPVAASSHLVDDDTDSYLPSPSNSVDAPSGSSAPSTGRLSGSFEKLKLQKLKVIAEKARLARREVKKYGNAVAIEDTIFDKSIGSDSEPDFSKSKKIVRGLRREKNTSRASHMQDIQDRMSTQREDVKYSSPRIKQVPGGSASSFRGWGRGVRPEPIPVDSPVRQRKFSSDNEFFSRKSFKDLGCSEFMIEALRGQDFHRPSHIQAMAFAPVIDGRTCIIADQSGSGKTLAYLIPIIQRLRQGELQGLGEISTGSPQVFVMVPTAELASQVLNNCRQLSKFGVPFRSMVATGGFRQKTQLEALEQGVDVLIATPGRFMFLIKEGFLKLEQLRCVVLDEVDILFNDEDFEVSMQSLINSAPVTSQYLFVTATLPVHVYNKLVEAFPDCEVAMGPGIHRTSNKLEEVLLDCSGESEAEKTPESAFDNKKSALLQLVEQSPVSKTIVFCNKIETCRKVENALKRFDRKGVRVQVLPFHAALAQEARVANMKEFMNSSPKGESLFLVCTDRASRGIDFTGVDHVVLFDFPRDPSEYVRRVGRTARGARGTGKAFIFAVGKQVSLARRIIERNQKGHPLHDVPAAYELIA